jgi:hypothetical protein
VCGIPVTILGIVGQVPPSDDLLQEASPDKTLLMNTRQGGKDRSLKDRDVLILEGFEHLKGVGEFFVRGCQGSLRRSPDRYTSLVLYYITSLMSYHFTSLVLCHFTSLVLRDLTSFLLHSIKSPASQ